MPNDDLFGCSAHVALSLSRIAQQGSSLGSSAEIKNAAFCRDEIAGDQMSHSTREAAIWSVFRRRSRGLRAE